MSVYSLTNAANVGHRVNLGISNMDFMDFIEEEEISFIQDPDYVGPVEEDDEDELSASSG